MFRDEKLFSFYYLKEQRQQNKECRGADSQRRGRRVERRTGASGRSVAARRRRCTNWRFRLWCDCWHGGDLLRGAEGHGLFGDGLFDECGGFDKRFDHGLFDFTAGRFGGELHRHGAEPECGVHARVLDTGGERHRGLTHGDVFGHEFEERGFRAAEATDVVAENQLLFLFGGNREELGDSGDRCLGRAVVVPRLFQLEQHEAAGAARQRFRRDFEFVEAKVFARVDKQRLAASAFAHSGGGAFAARAAAALLTAVGDEKVAARLTILVGRHFDRHEPLPALLHRARHGVRDRHDAGDATPFLQLDLGRRVAGAHVLLKIDVGFLRGSVAGAAVFERR